MKKEIKYRRNVMCLNYPQIHRHHHSSSWENCLPPKRSWCQKGWGFAETEGPSFRKQGSKFQKNYRPHFPMCSLLCPSTPEDSRTPLGVVTLLRDTGDLWLLQLSLQGHPHVDSTIYGWSCICPKTFPWSSALCDARVGVKCTTQERYSPCLQEIQKLLWEK